MPPRNARRAASVKTLPPRPGGALAAAAREARRHAYAPKSGRRVGAAVQTADGSIYTGANIEIGMNELGVCAERAALYKALSEGHRRITAVAVAYDVPLAPCGLCRQALWKFAASPRMPVLSVSQDGTKSRRRSIAALLPEASTREARQ